jgi:hypothetical protein
MRRTASSAPTMRKKKWEDNECEVVPLGSQRDGDGGGDGGISNLGALLWIPSRKTERVHPGGTPLNRACPSLLQDVSGLMSPSLLPSSSWRCIAK